MKRDNVIYMQNKWFKIFIFVFCLLPIFHEAKAQNPNSFSIPVTRSSFFALEKDGTLKLNNKGLPYQGTNELYTQEMTFSPLNSAVFVIDPWNNMPVATLNQHSDKIIQSYILPLIKAASKNNFPIYIFTNDCKNMKPVAYSCEISKEFYWLAQKYPNVKIVYWDELRISDFIATLRKNGISNLIYLGFHSNMCVLGRPAGIINMLQEGFSLFFIPEASAAMETKETWKSQKIHHATTKIISQSMAKLINYSDIYSKMQN